VYKSGIGEDKVNKLYIQLHGKDEVLIIDNEDDFPCLKRMKIGIPHNNVKHVDIVGYFLDGVFSVVSFVHQNQRITIFEKCSNCQDSMKFNVQAIKCEEKKRTPTSYELKMIYR
jgi:hypothetical protein